MMARHTLDAHGLVLLVAHPECLPLDLVELFVRVLLVKLVGVRGGRVCVGEAGRRAVRWAWVSLGRVRWRVGRNGAVARSLGRLVGWSVGRLMSWSVGPLVGWSVGLRLARGGAARWTHLCCQHLERYDALHLQLLSTQADLALSTACLVDQRLHHLAQPQPAPRLRQPPAHNVARGGGERDDAELGPSLIVRVARDVLGCGGWGVHLDGL